MKINYKSKSKILAWVVFSSSSNSFMLSALVFAVSELIFTFLLEFYDMLPSIIIALLTFALSLAVQMIIYKHSSKSAEVVDDKLVIHFGYVEFGIGAYADINKKIKLENIISCTVSNEYTPLKIHKLFLLKYDNEVYNEARWEIQNGNYEMPYLKIYMQSNQVLYLPVEDAEMLCNIINERKTIQK